MKVLFIATYSGTSGASHSLLTMVNLLKEKGVKPLVIVPNHGPLEQLLNENNIPCKRIKLFNWITSIENKGKFKNRVKWKVKTLINFIQEIRIYTLIKREQINIVHINASTADWGYNAAKFSKIPVVWHIREFLEEDLGKTFINVNKSLKYLSDADCVIAISNSVKKKYSNLINNKNLIRIYNGIDINPYRNINNNLFKRDIINLTLAGRVSSGKGHEDAIYALKHLTDNGFKKVKLRFIGTEGNKDYIKYIKELVIKLNLEKYIDFINYRKDMNNVWGETDIALVCSKAEAFGRVTIEGMLGGAIVIGADTEGTKELVSLDNGLLYEQGNYLSLADKIIFAIENQESMIELAKHSKQYAEDNFRAEINASKIFELYGNMSC